jgi:hypothetical protein
MKTQVVPHRPIPNLVHIGPQFARQRNATGLAALSEDRDLAGFPTLAAAHDCNPVESLKRDLTGWLKRKVDVEPARPSAAFASHLNTIRREALASRDGTCNQEKSDQNGTRGCTKRGRTSVNPARRTMIRARLAILAGDCPFL